MAGGVDAFDVGLWDQLLIPELDVAVVIVRADSANLNVSAQERVFAAGGAVGVVGTSAAAGPVVTGCGILRAEGRRLAHSRMTVGVLRHAASSMWLGAGGARRGSHAQKRQRRNGDLRDTAD